MMGMKIDDAVPFIATSDELLGPIELVRQTFILIPNENKLTVGAAIAVLFHSLEQFKITLAYFITLFFCNSENSD